MTTRQNELEAGKELNRDKHVSSINRVLVLTMTWNQTMPMAVPWERRGDDNYRVRLDGGQWAENDYDR